MVALVLAAILVVIAVLFRRARRRIKALAISLEEASVAKALVNQLGIGGRWADAKDSGGPPWLDVCKEIQRPGNTVLDILGANGIETFGERGSPLYFTMQTFTGTVRVVLLHPAGRETAGRASSVGTDVRSYRKAIIASQARLRELRKQHRAVDGRFYDGQPNWKLIITSRTAWVQYYAPTGKHVNETPMYRFDASEDEDRSSLFHLFHMEFDRIWRRCAELPMKLD